MQFTMAHTANLLPHNQQVGCPSLLLGVAQEGNPNRNNLDIKVLQKY